MDVDENVSGKQMHVNKKRDAGRKSGDKRSECPVKTLRDAKKKKRQEVGKWEAEISFL